jgi:hypothetical protein
VTSHEGHAPATIQQFLELWTGSTFPSEVTLDAPRGSPPASGWVTNRLERGSASRFWVCIAIVLTRKTGLAWSSNAYGITEPNGNPGCLREWVERLPTRPRCSRVRARSANEGSGIEGRAVPELACFPAIGEDILRYRCGFGFLGTN